jgi:cellulose synthase/poly-beta-1,6-N-acetylglucosamine synthase-like glycosyltransferase
MAARASAAVQPASESPVGAAKGVGGGGAARTTSDGERVSSGERPTVVCVPARNEVARIGACLRALLDQRDRHGHPLRAPVQVLVLANNCVDGTADAAQAVDPRVHVVRTRLPAGRATAGLARRLAMDKALQLLGEPGGVICTTDADSRARPDWVASLWSALDTGAAAVAGVVEFDPLSRVPTFSPARGLEAVYAGLQAELTARLDPEPHNPWPNHIWAWGANLAVTSEAYRAVGGLPPVRIAEDRAFVARLRRHDIPVRHCLDARVWTSARVRGRAPGGLADLVADHGGSDRAPCDCALEPAFAAAGRALWRHRFRSEHARGSRQGALAWERRLDTPAGLLPAALQASFGEGWHAIEQASARLARRRLTLGDLPREIGRARRLLHQLRPSGAADPGDTARAAAAGLWLAPTQP